MRAKRASLLREAAQKDPEAKEESTDMQRTAYLVIFVEVGTGAFKGAGIYSESGQQLTMGGGNTTPATVFECTANSYQAARDAVVANCRMFRHLQWLIPHIEK